MMANSAKSIKLDGGANASASVNVNAGAGAVAGAGAGAGAGAAGVAGACEPVASSRPDLGGFLATLKTTQAQDASADGTDVKQPDSSATSALTRDDREVNDAREAALGALLADTKAPGKSSPGKATTANSPADCTAPPGTTIATVAALDNASLLAMLGLAAPAQPLLMTPTDSPVASGTAINLVTGDAAGSTAQPRGGIATGGAAATGSALVASSMSDAVSVFAALATQLTAMGDMKSSDTALTRIEGTSLPTSDDTKQFALDKLSDQVESLATVNPPRDPAALAPATVTTTDAVITAPIGSKLWQDQLNGHVSWMIDRGEQFATLRLSPPHLGPVEVRVAVRESEATVWFCATNPETRQALQHALPQLRDMLASQGIAMGQSGVFREGSQRSHWHAPPAQPLGSRETPESRSAAVSSSTAIGLLDVYA